MRNIIKKNLKRAIQAFIFSIITIGTISYLNALLVGVDRVYFIGRTSLLNSVRDGVDKRLKLAGVTGIYKANREFANAIGALAYLKPKI